VNELTACEILLVEDNENDAEITIRTLKNSHLVNNVLRVKDGEEALDFVFRRGAYASRDDTNPRLVLLDLNLPKVNGIEVLRAIRGDERTKSIPVIMLTGSEQEKDLIDSYSLRVSGYLVKPVGSPEFAGVVAELGFLWGVLKTLDTTRSAKKK
jgi:two-component system response regulator